MNKKGQGEKNNNNKRKTPRGTRLQEPRAQPGRSAFWLWSRALPAPQLPLDSTWLLSAAGSVSRGTSERRGQAVGHTSPDGQTGQKPEAGQWRKIGTKWAYALEVNIFLMTCNYTNTVQIPCPFKTVKPSRSRACPSRPLPQGNRRWLSLCASPSTSQEAPMEKEMATHSSILAWKISWTDEPGGLVSGIAESYTTQQLNNNNTQSGRW